MYFWFGILEMERLGKIFKIWSDLIALLAYMYIFIIVSFLQISKAASSWKFDI